MDAAMMKFNVLKFCSEFIYKAHVLDAQVRINMELTRGHQESRAVQERDKAEIRDVLQKIVKSTDDMRALLNMQSSQPIDEIMESLQTVRLQYINPRRILNLFQELHNPSLQPNQEQTFKEGLWLLHEKTSKLPPLTDCAS